MYFYIPNLIVLIPYVAVVDATQSVGLVLRQFSIADHYYMQLALAQAQWAAQHGEVPVGAVIVDANGNVYAGFNSPISSNDSTAHAEIVAIRQACRMQQNYRLLADCTLYVTLEPCTMCVGAMVHARIARVVYATHEPRAGALVSNLQLMEQPCYNHYFRVEHGLYAQQSAALLQRFFRDKRQAAVTTTQIP